MDFLSFYPRCFFITVSLFLILQSPCFGEKKNTDPVLDQYTLFEQYVGQDSLALSVGLEGLWQKARRENSDDLKTVYYVLLGQGQTRLQKGQSPTTRKIFKDAIGYAKKSKRPEVLLWATHHVAYCYYRSRKMAEALPYFVESKRLLLDIPEEKVIDKTGMFKKLGYMSGTMGQHIESVDYLYKALSYVGNDLYEKAEILDNLAVDLLERQDTATAKKHFLQAMQITRANDDPVRYAKVLGNMSRISAAEGNIAQAVSYLKEDIAISRKQDDQQNILYASLRLAELYVKEDSLKVAEVMLNDIAKLLDHKDHLVTFAQRYVKIKLDISLKNHDIVSEMKFRRLLDTLESNANNWDGNNVIASSRNLIEAQMLFDQRKVTAKGQESSMSRKVFYGLSAGILIVLIGAIGGFRIVRWRNKLKQNMTPPASVLADNVRQESAGRLSELLASHLMTDDKWIEFKGVFEKEYPEFCARLTTDFEEVNETHLRYIALSKLGLNRRKIGEVLGVTEGAVKKTRQRLRKKMSDEKFEKLEKLMSS